MIARRILRAWTAMALAGALILSAGRCGPAPDETGAICTTDIECELLTGIPVSESQ